MEEMNLYLISLCLRVRQQLEVKYVGEQSVFPVQVGQLIPPACCGSVQGFPLSWIQEHGQGRSRPYGQKTELLRLTVLIKLSSHMSTVALTAPIMG